MSPSPNPLGGALVFLCSYPNRDDAMAATPNLDGGYNVFGRVTDGMSVVNNIVVGDKILSVSVREN